MTQVMSCVRFIESTHKSSTRGND